MTRPIVVMYNHIHKALGGEMEKLEEHARSIDPGNAESVGGFAGHLGMIDSLLEVHANEEERVVWPEIEKRMPALTGSYLLDHEAERELFAQIRSHLAGMQQPGADKVQAQAGLLRDVGVATEQLKLHMRKEEKDIYGPFADRLSEQEEMDIGRRVLEGLPAEILPQAMPWLVSYLTAEEVAEGFTIYARAAGPERARLFIAPLPGGMPPEKWQQVLGHAPELANYL